MASDRFKGRVAVVTGGASGIGRATALALAAEGAGVAISDVSAKGAREVAEEIAASGGTAWAAACDASDPGQVAGSVESILARFGCIDVLVNSAGVFGQGPAAQMSAAEWRRVLSVNLDGAFYWSRAVAGASMIPNRRGAVVNVASVAGLVAAPMGAAYVASKHGLVGLSKALAVEWAPHGVRVNALCPGFTETPMVAQARQSNPALFEDRVRRIPLGAAASAEDQATAILFLASAQAAMITGVALSVDGGTVALSSAFAAQRPA